MKILWATSIPTLKDDSSEESAESTPEQVENENTPSEDVSRIKGQLLLTALLLPFVLICLFSLVAQRPYIVQQVKTLFAVDTAWTGKYFPNQNLSGRPAQTREDGVITFEWGQGSPFPDELGNDGFSAEWKRSDLFEDRLYVFALRSDDGARMYLDGKLIIDVWEEGPHDWVEYREVMTAGRHRIRVEYFEVAGDAYIQAGYYIPEQ